MKVTIIRKSFRETVYRSFTLIARILPLWKETRAEDVLPPMFSLPVSLPVNYEKLPEEFANQFVKTKSIPGRRIFVMKDVWVSGRGVVFKYLRIFAPSLPWLRDMTLYRKGMLFVKQWAKDVQEIPDTEIVALVYDNWSAENYYHWMIESLPRLLLVQKKYPDFQLLIPDPAPGYIRSTIDLLGFKNVLPLSRRDDKVIKVSNLALPELVYYEEEEYGSQSAYRLQQATASEKNMQLPGSVPLPRLEEEELIVKVRRKLLKHFYNKPAVPERRIFVSRSRQNTRRLLNENEVLPVLEKYGFEIIYFEGLSFNEQVQLMLETAVFVSVHGSNMVNILFLQSGARVVEMMNQAFLNDAYYLMASSIGLAYYSVPCTMPGTTMPLSEDTVAINDADLVVNVPELEETLHTALQQPERVNKAF
ncbi:glycosyltransferase family 61 protein [Pontibacter diazotrophicus]|uniref:Glycosyltransferase family 61 protein n=2 Tax=Pontibacter diazotrophicus TaxID=1400979 RepID=A0A3D8LH53_9BACT|nr:glycosyltransferase family 61 protein [Pontibacter diazotrophicus]